MLTYIAGAVFLLTVSLIFLVISFLTRSQRHMKKRLESVIQVPAEESISSTAKNRKRRVERAASGAESSIWQRLVSADYLHKIQLELLKSGLPFKAEELLNAKCLGALIAFLLGFILLGSFTSGLILGLIGFLLPQMWVSYNRNRRLHNIDEQLLEAILLMSGALKSGNSFLQALELVSRETMPPLAEEFQRLLHENRIGLGLDEAMNNLVSRTESKEIELMVAGVLIQREVGGNLAEVLDNIAKTIEKRIKMQARLRALTAQGRMSAWIISLLPVVLAFLLFNINPEYMLVLIKEPLGRVMLVLGGVMLFIGITLIRKVVDIDV